MGFNCGKAGFGSAGSIIIAMATRVGCTVATPVITKVLCPDPCIAKCEALERDEDETAHLGRRLLGRGGGKKKKSSSSGGKCKDEELDKRVRESERELGEAMQDTVSTGWGKKKKDKKAIRRCKHNCSVERCRNNCWKLPTKEQAKTCIASHCKRKKGGNGGGKRLGAGRKAKKQKRDAPQQKKKS